jgi:hypothetical protein
MSAGAASEAAEQAAIAQAIRASGVHVRIASEDFLEIIGRQQAPLIVSATGGFFSTNYCPVHRNLTAAIARFPAEKRHACMTNTSGHTTTSTFRVIKAWHSSRNRRNRYRFREAPRSSWLARFGFRDRDVRSSPLEKERRQAFTWRLPEIIAFCRDAS